jgi:mevalonate kinase
VEKIHHGTPSGIDNSVVAYEAPVFFRRGHPVSHLDVGAPLHLLIADTGVRSSTKQVVAYVRSARELQPTHYDALFDEIGHIAQTAKHSISTGDDVALGALMHTNHLLLVKVGVSSERLDRLVDAAQRAGALGAKLSGAGQGGNVVALVHEGTTSQVTRRLRRAGAVRVLSTTVGPSSDHRR